MGTRETTAAAERKYELDMAARLAMELQDGYRLPGGTWELVFDMEDTDEDGEGMTDEDALLRIRSMLDEDGGIDGIEAFLEETAEGFITDDRAEVDWRIAKAALTLLRGRENHPQPPLKRNAGVGRRTAGLRGLQALRWLEGAGRRGCHPDLRRLLLFRATGGARSAEARRLRRPRFRRGASRRALRGGMRLRRVEGNVGQ